jgi:uncharacterized membrane protein YiaA
MVEIRISRGLIARVSPADAEAVLRHSWHAHPARRTTYAATKVRGKGFYMHRLIMGVTERFAFVDHIDRDGLNNERENLRVCTPAQNLANSVKREKRIGRRGVWVDMGRWMARIVINKKGFYLGAFATEHEAGIAYDSAFFVTYGFMPND